MLPPLIESHAPLDIVLIMLGTNDSAPCYGLTAGKIAIELRAPDPHRAVESRRDRFHARRTSF